MTQEQGNLAINSENIFPIIKKWLYSDHDIFLREVVSNGCDAITKRKKLSLIGEADLPEELKNVIGEKKTAPFKLTYTDDQNLYIVVGYGEQESGGYSIAVKELYLTENAIVADTELIGPQSGEETGVEKSYPYVVVKTEYLEHPVIFQS